MIQSGVTDLNNPPRAYILVTIANGDRGITVAGFPDGFVGSNRATVIQLLPGDSSYSAQLAFGFNDYIAIRCKLHSGPWRDWNYIQ